MFKAKSEIPLQTPAPEATLPSQTAFPRKKPFSLDGYEISESGAQVNRYAFYIADLTQIVGISFTEYGNLFLELAGKFENLLKAHKKYLVEAGFFKPQQFAVLAQEIEKLQNAPQNIISMFDREAVEEFDIEVVLSSLGFHPALITTLKTAYYLAIYEVDFLGQVPAELRLRGLSLDELEEELKRELAGNIQQMGQVLCPEHPFTASLQAGLGSDNEEEDEEHDAKVDKEDEHIRIDRDFARAVVAPPNDNLSFQKSYPIDLAIRAVPGWAQQIPPGVFAQQRDGFVQGSVSRLADNVRKYLHDYAFTNIEEFEAISMAIEQFSNQDFLFYSLVRSAAAKLWNAAVAVDPDIIRIEWSEAQAAMQEALNTICPFFQNPPSFSLQVVVVPPVREYAPSAESKVDAETQHARPSRERSQPVSFPVSFDDGGGTAEEAPEATRLPAAALASASGLSFSSSSSSSSSSTSTPILPPTPTPARTPPVSPRRNSLLAEEQRQAVQKEGPVFLMREP